MKNLSDLSAMTEHEWSTVIICKGPPVCDLMDDEAVAAQKAGCPWCKRIRIDAYGYEETTDVVSV